MEPQEFLAAVLPPPGHGYYCLADVYSASKPHIFVEQIADFWPTVDEWLLQRQHVFFALATFDPVVLTLKKDRRTVHNSR
jgi:hypothetical protein